MMERLEAEEKVAHRLGGLPADGGAQEDAGEPHGVLAEGRGGQRVRDEKGARDRADASEHRDGRGDALEVRGERHGAREARAGDADEAEMRRPRKGSRERDRRVERRGARGVEASPETVDGRQHARRWRARRRRAREGECARGEDHDASPRATRPSVSAERRRRRIPRILSDGFSESRRTTNSQIVLPSDDSKRQLANVCDFRTGFVSCDNSGFVRVSPPLRIIRAGHSGISAISPSPVTVASPPSPRSPVTVASPSSPRPPPPRLRGPITPRRLRAPPRRPRRSPRPAPPLSSPRRVGPRATARHRR